MLRPRLPPLPLLLLTAPLTPSGPVGRGVSCLPAGSLGYGGAGCPDGGHGRCRKPVAVDGPVDESVDNRGWMGDKWHWAVEGPVDRKTRGNTSEEPLAGHADAALEIRHVNGDGDRPGGDSGTQEQRETAAPAGSRKPRTWCRGVDDRAIGRPRHRGRAASDLVSNHQEPGGAQGHGARRPSNRTGSGRGSCREAHPLSNRRASGRGTAVGGAPKE